MRTQNILKIFEIIRILFRPFSIAEIAVPKLKLTFFTLIQINTKKTVPNTPSIRYNVKINICNLRICKSFVFNSNLNLLTMKTFFLSLCLVLGSVSVGFAQAVFPIGAGSSNRFIVSLPALTTAQNRLLNQAKTVAGVTVVSRLANLDMELWQLPTNISAASLAALTAAAINLRLTVQTNGVFETVPEQSGRAIPKIRVSETAATNATVRAAIWTEERFLRPCALGGVNAVRVGIIDGGVSLNAQGRPYGDLRYFDAQGSKDFTGEVSNNLMSINDLSGHGTHTFGVLNKVYTRLGINTNSKITVLKAFTQDGRGSLWNILGAINYSMTLRLNILSMSFNYVDDNKIRSATNSQFILEKAIDKAKVMNMLIICSAGNQGENVDANNARGFYPTVFTNNNLITVAATEDSTFFRPAYSNYGVRSVDIAAPGTMLTQHIGGDETAYVACGTSFAAPIVTGHAVLMASRNPVFNYAVTKLMLTARLSRNVPAWVGKLQPQGGVMTPLCSSYGYSRNAGDATDSTPLSESLQLSYVGNVANMTYTGKAGEIGMIIIANMAGQTVATQKITVPSDGQVSWTWFSDDLQNGMYLLHCQVGDKIAIQKIVKTQ
jgi:subtilisin family serine protease